MSGITTSETDAFILIHVAESIFAARDLQHNISKPAQRRDDAGADVGIVARKHRGNASTRRCKATYLPRNCVAPTLTMQELLAAKAGRLMSV
jgi:hypothetical protein